MTIAAHLTSWKRIPSLDAEYSQEKIILFIDSENSKFMIIY